MQAVREATEADLPAMRDIYNDVVRTSTAIFTENGRSPSEQQKWWRDRTAAHLPVLIAVEDGEVAGYASYGPFRPWPGYRHTIEHSVYVRADRRGSGHGRALLTALIGHARAAGAHVMIAGVDAGNAASLALHQRHGFRPAGRLHEVAVKHDQWLDLVFLELALEPG